MSFFVFTVPGKAVGKGRPRFGNGRTYTPAKTRDWEALVRDHAALCRQEPIAGAVEVSIAIVVTPPTRWRKAVREEAVDRAWYAQGRGDLDNIAKSILDACNGVCYRDDAQVVRLEVTRVYGEENEVTVNVFPIQTGEEV